MPPTAIEATQQRFTTLLDEANTLLNDGKVAEARAKREEAVTVKSQIDEWREIAALQATTTTLTPMRPPMPGVADGGSQVIQQIQTETPPPEAPLVKAAYINRFGTPEQEIEAIMVDLHGREYAKVFWSQKGSFNKYLRHGEVALTSDDRTLLHQIVMTPGAIKTALAQGVGSVETLKTVMIEAADSLGGYTVPVDTQSRIIERIRGATIVRGRAKQMNTSRDRVEMPRMIDTGGDATNRYKSPVRVRWVDETPASLDAQNLTFGMVGIPVHTSMVEAFLSRNLLEDSAFPLESYLEEAFSDAAAIDEDDQFLFGDGVGKPQGILPGFTNSLTLPEVTTGLTASPWFNWNKLIAVPYEIPRQYRQNSAWMCNRKTVMAIRQLRDTTTGDYYWTPFAFQGGEDGEPVRLLGFPIVEQEGFPDLANGAYSMLFGDLQGYQILDRVGMTVERFVDSFVARQNLVCFVMRRRLGGQLLEPWRLVATKVAA